VRGSEKRATMARVTQLVFIAVLVATASAAPVFIGGTYFGEDTVVEEAPVEVEPEIPPNSAEITGMEMIQATGIKLHGVHDAHHAAPAKPVKGKKVAAEHKIPHHKVKKPVKHKVIAKSSGNLYQNCMTTKAYAMSKADYIVEQTARNLGVVKNFLIELAKKGDCLSQFRQWSKMAMLNFDAKDSINKHLARLIRFRMIHRHGILTWHRNKVYVSGKKIGLTGDVDLLSKGNLVATSFEVQKVMYEISGGKSHAVVEGKVNKFGKPVAKVKNPYTVKDADTLLKGQCRGAVSLFCGRYTQAGRRVCIATGCQWRGPWNGREEEEIAVSVPPPEWQGNEEP